MYYNVLYYIIVYSLSLSIYIYIYVYVCVYIYIYIYMSEGGESRCPVLRKLCVVPSWLIVIRNDQNR